jgi:Flp pilus assembly pilin Flp
MEKTMELASGEAFMEQQLRRLARDEAGATAAEYALMASLVAVAVAVTVGTLGVAVRGLFHEPELSDALTRR